MKSLKQLVFTFLIAFILICFIPSNLKYPTSYKTENFPYVRQPDQITCGPTSMFMILKYKQIKTTLDEVKSKTKTEWFDINGQKIGMTIPEMIPVALKNYKITSSVKTGGLSYIKYYISKGKLPIILLRSGKTTWHYVVAIGYDENNIFVADPGRGKELKIENNIFLNAWAFKSDMNGIKMENSCSICGGDGSIFPTILGKCDICGGTGISGDYMKSLIGIAEVYPNTYILVD